ncbi:hypothetical protein [Cryptosporangium sp. NPDC051539]|uniref:hypothetical protein n=1 Tax=Cryptosporangium sp. NPDC051539 TaxID=3363962 RepID=UPI00379B749A
MSGPPIRRHRRPHWLVSGVFWGVLVLADVAIFSVWATLGAMVLAACGAGGFTWRHRRMLRSVVAVPVTGPSGAPIEISTEPVAPTAPTAPLEPDAGGGPGTPA